MSKAEMQRALGVAWSTIRNWEENGAVPDRDNTALIIDRLKLTPEERQGLLEAVSYVPPSATPGSPRGRHSSASPRAVPVPQVAAGELNAAQQAMSEALNKVLDVDKDPVLNVVVAVQTIAEGGEAFLTVTKPAFTARAWLDAAALLRSRGLAVTAGNLAAILPEAIAQRYKLDEPSR